MTSLAQRFHAAKKHQAKALGFNRERNTAPAHVVPDAQPPVQGVDREQYLSELNAEFDALFEPVMDFWGCDADEREHINTNWRREGVLEHTVRMWQTQVITYDLQVPQPTLGRAYMTFKTDIMIPADVARRAEEARKASNASSLGNDPAEGAQMDAGDSKSEESTVMVEAPRKKRFRR